MTEERLKHILIGLNKGSFLKFDLNQRYLSLCHALSLQPLKSVKLLQHCMPDGYAGKDYLYMWFPTPPDEGAEYVAEARAMINRLAPNEFSDVVVDLRGNIGGHLCTFIDAILPLIITEMPELFLEGRNNRDEPHANFYVHKSNLQMEINYIGSVDYKCGLVPVENADRFAGKRFHIICNRFTMSSGEILCIIFRNLGHKLYGEKTRGLTNGCVTNEFDNAKALVPVHYLGLGKTFYRDGVTPDYPLAKLPIKLN